MIIVASIIVLAAVGAVIAGAVNKNGLLVGGGVLGAIVGILVGIWSMAYTQGAGEAKVIVSFSGEVKGSDTSEGLDWHAPFDTLVDYDIRNKQAAFSNAGNTKIPAEELLGGELDFTDKNGAAGKLDIIVRYSLKPTSVEDIYRAFGTQEKFEATLISPEIKTAIKEVPGAFTTIEMRTDRAKVGAAIEKNLVAKWEKEGVIVDEVSLQDVRYSDEVNKSFDDAQVARNRVTTEKANLEAAEISSKQKVVQANAEAEANRKIDASLTPEVLQLRGYDTLKHVSENGDLIMTDGRSVFNLPVPSK